LLFSTVTPEKDIFNQLATHLTETTHNINLSNNKKMTPLLVAAFAGNIDAIKFSL
jgi:hypothetical protein